MAVTVFDTNAYQRLPSAQLAPLIAAEHRDGIVAYADPWVAIELVGKLVDEKGRPHARAAIKKIYCHCGGGATPGMIIDCEDQVCRILLEQAPEGYAETRAAIEVVIDRVARSKDDDTLGDIMPAVKELADHLQRVEDERATTVFGAIVQGIVPGATSWNAILREKQKQALVLASIDRGEAFAALIESEIRRAHTTLGITIPEPIPRWMHDVHPARNGLWDRDAKGGVSSPDLAFDECREGLAAIDRCKHQCLLLLLSEDGIPTRCARHNSLHNCAKHSSCSLVFYPLQVISELLNCRHDITERVVVFRPGDPIDYNFDRGSSLCITLGSLLQENTADLVFAVNNHTGRCPATTAVIERLDGGKSMTP